MPLNSPKLSPYQNFLLSQTPKERAASELQRLKYLAEAKQMKNNKSRNNYIKQLIKTEKRIKQQ